MVLDINKYFEKTGICDKNAACTNIPGGKSGFTDTYGDGSNCIGETTLEQLLSCYFMQLILVACPCINVIQGAILGCKIKYLRVGMSYWYLGNHDKPMGPLILSTWCPGLVLYIITISNMLSKQ